MADERRGCVRRGWRAVLCRPIPVRTHPHPHHHHHRHLPHHHCPHPASPFTPTQGRGIPRPRQHWLPGAEGGAGGSRCNERGGSYDERGCGWRGRGWRGRGCCRQREWGWREWQRGWREWGWSKRRCRQHQCRQQERQWQRYLALPCHCGPGGLRGHAFVSRRRPPPPLLRLPAAAFRQNAPAAGGRVFDAGARAAGGACDGAGAGGQGAEGH